MSSARSGEARRHKAAKVVWVGRFMGLVGCRLLSIRERAHESFKIMQNLASRPDEPKKCVSSALIHKGGASFFYAFGRWMQSDFLRYHSLGVLHSSGPP